MATNKLMLGAVLLLGFCLVGDALVPGFQPHHGGDDKKVGAWWWLSGSSGPRKLLKPAGGVGAHLTTMEEQQLVATTDWRQLAEAHDAVGYKPISRPCTPYMRCKLPETPPRPPCKPYSRCRQIPPQP